MAMIRAGNMVAMCLVALAGCGGRAQNGADDAAVATDSSLLAPDAPEASDMDAREAAKINAPDSGTCALPSDCIDFPIGEGAVACCLDQTCIYGQAAINAVACTDADVELILASNYDQSCQADSDCAGVAEGNFCLAGARDCPSAAINKSAYGRYQADVAGTNAAICSAVSGCGGFPTSPCCRSGSCQWGAECISPADAGADAGDGSGAMDASTACDELEDAAVQQFNAIDEQNLGCSQDTDCVWTSFAQGGWCVANCGALTNEAGGASLQSAANRLCQSFLAQGCKPPESSCPYFGPFICAGGTCASYSFYPTPYPLPILTHGVCTALQLTYSPNGGSAIAPHDLVVSMSASNATLYSDPACTMPLNLTTGSLTIRSGLPSVAFGITATASGVCFLDIDRASYTLAAQ
jgi:hypothetical protein